VDIEAVIMYRVEFGINWHYPLLCIGFALVAGIPGCGRADSSADSARSGADVAPSTGRVSSQAMKTFFGAELPADCCDNVAALTAKGNSQGVELILKAWPDFHRQVTNRSLLPVLLTHKTRSPVVLADIFTFESDTYFLLVTQDMKPFTMQKKEFMEAEWTHAVWRHRPGTPADDVVAIGPAKLSVNRLWRSFGATTPFTVVHSEFRLSNVSQTPLRMVSINTSCGCTTVGGVTAKSLSPGASAVIPVSVRTGSDPLIQQSVVITLTAGEATKASFIKLSLFGWQPKAIESMPRNLDFGRVYRDHPAEMTVRLTEAAADKYQIQSINVGTLPITFATERRAEGHLVHMHLNVLGLSTGDHSGVVHITNTSRWRPNVELPVHFSVASEIKARPGIVEFRDLSPDRPSGPVTVTLEHRKKEPLNVAILDMPAVLSAKIRGRGPQSEVVFYACKGQDRSSTGTVRLSAHWENGEEIVELPFYIFPRSR
jgi:hypothetical protein